jgi:Leucine-rich repeat (LRR) protein
LKLHKNLLTSLPKTFADLSFLTILDLSQNQLTSLPDNLWSLPELTTLNISDNMLRSLPFAAPFQSASKRPGPNSYASTDFFTPAVVRAVAPLPKLVNLNASHNRISASSIDLNIPSSIVKLDLSENPIGDADTLLQKLATLPRLSELRFEKAEIHDGTITSVLFSSFTSPPFPRLRLLDFSETTVAFPSVQATFSSLTQELEYDFTNDDPAPGVTRILVGKRVIKETWEIELERRAHGRVNKGSGLGDWEPETPKPRARTLSTAAPVPEITATPASPPPVPQTRQPRKPPPTPISRKEAVKEAWEIEAEQGLLTEGGKRRARAAAAAREEEERSAASSSTSNGLSLSNAKYYNATTQTLTLPTSSPAPKATGVHNRSFSLASSSFTSASPAPRSEDLAMPAPTLPLSVILAQPFAESLRVLILTNRRLDRSFAVPSNIPPSGFLPCLEELDVEGCNFDDAVPIQRVEPSEDGTSGISISPSSNEQLLPILTKLFPSLRSLNLSYNRISDAALTFEALSGLILQSPERKGLRVLKLRGNRLSELNGFQKVAELFKGNRAVPEWKMEELDLRDNEVGKLPAELGLLPLDVFLVEGNT